MLQQTFLNRSWRVLIIEEHDRRLVGNNPGATVWQDYATVLRRLSRIPFEVVAAKPLVESDRVAELMDAAYPVKAIWMLRHYEGVARSSVRRFGPDNPYRDLQSFCVDDPLDWRCRGATKETRETVFGLLKEGLSPLDAAALFWWARNQLYFDQHLSRDERIRILRYERARNRSEEVVEALSDYVKIRLPMRSIASKVRPHTDGPGVTDLHPDVERLCLKLWDSFAGCPELQGEPLRSGQAPCGRTGLVRSTSDEALASASVRCHAMGAHAGAGMTSQGSLRPSDNASRCGLRTFSAA